MPYDFRIGIVQIGNKLIHKAKGRQRKEQDSHVHIDEEDQEYMPEENADDDLLNDEKEHAFENVFYGLTSSCLANKVKKMMTRR